MDYKLMCFPCLRRKKKLESYGSSSELDVRFDYIIDKYTIRKIPLLLEPESLTQPTQEDISTKTATTNDVPLDEKVIGDFAKFGVTSEAFSLQTITPVLPVTTHSSRSVKEKPRPADILDSTSQVPRRSITKPNYVAIPSKASLHAKDIMMTKREITNQYLNNFSSVFVDNLKDQVPKDPENLPKLSRPYTSAMKDLCVDGNLRKSSRKKAGPCRSKVQKLVYALPDGSIIETESEGSCQSLTDDDNVPVHSSHIHVEKPEIISTPFKNKIKEESSFLDNKGPESESAAQSKKEPGYSNSSKQITYEAIQALDVGYEFPNGEKYGVKPKMTRIRISNFDVEKSMARPSHAPIPQTESYRKNLHLQDRIRPHSTGKILNSSTATRPKNEFLRDRDYSEDLRSSSQKNYGPRIKMANFNVIDSSCSEYSRQMTEDSEKDNLKSPFVVFRNVQKNYESDRKAETDFTTSSRENYSQHTVPKSSCIRPSSVPSERREVSSNFWHRSDSFLFLDNLDSPTYNMPYKSAMVSMSRSYDSLSSAKKEEKTRNKQFRSVQPNRMYELESDSLYSRESKTSSHITSPITSEPEIRKKATLRWKIIIKHHKDDMNEEKILTNENS